MTWTTPTSELVQTLRLRDGPHYVIPEEYLANLLVDAQGNICFPIYGLDGSQVGWNTRAAKQKMWSQSIQGDTAPRFTAWTPNMFDIVYAHRKICLCEGPFDALALAPILPWTISANTARVQQEILEWCKSWGLHVFLALDKDTPDAKTQHKTGDEMTEKIYNELAPYCRVTRLNWNSALGAGRGMLPTQLKPPQHIKDPSQAYAERGKLFHDEIMQQVLSANITQIGATHG